MGVVVLISGGIDSIVMCKILENQGEEIIPIFVNYGQLSKDKEWESCLKLLKSNHLPSPKRIDIPNFGESFPSGITSKDKRIEEDAFLPCRNMLFILLGAAEAFQKDVEKIAIGILDPETHIFPDQTPEFIVNCNFAINSALAKDFIILTPLINLKKWEVIELAKKYKIDLSKTYSCHKGGNTYCGECIACKEILENKRDLPQFEE